ncbi:unnamed protein product [Parnassius mnemosyne]|uniref:Kazal-like domain-containing protein n=1 Tax=Parnassius mnemosyne TaxID=213953 RepID=A0AAV1LF51_9NEOP
MYFKLLLISLSTIGVLSHTPINSSDLIVTYEGHSEVENAKPVSLAKHDTPETGVGNEMFKVEPKLTKPVVTDTTEAYLEAKEDVVFIPNEKPVQRNEDYLYDREEVKMKDLLTSRVSDVLSDKKVSVETEAPSKDVVFISGKNQEYDAKDNTNKSDRKHRKEQPEIVPETRETFKTINCSNLDCNITQDPVCGGKLEQNKWKYRLFLNECFFRKVNCAFRYRENRYKQVPAEKCNNVGAQYSERPFVYIPHPLPTPKPAIVRNERRSFSSRRSMSMGSDGQFCSHACPASCTDDYEPQCGISATGQKRVFLNHCKLDFNSCFYRVVWHVRPLSWCVGGQMADMRQNRGFIAWLQRVGIVDKKGKLVLH